MEKPTGFIQKIIESLQQVNALDVYSPIEKDIILHNLRAAYMTILNIPTEAQSRENRVDELLLMGERMRELEHKIENPTVPEYIKEVIEEEEVVEEIEAPPFVENVEEVIYERKELEPASIQFEEDEPIEKEIVEEVEEVIEEIEAPPFVENAEEVIYERRELEPASTQFEKDEPIEKEVVEEILEEVEEFPFVENAEEVIYERRELEPASTQFEKDEPIEKDVVEETEEVVEEVSELPFVENTENIIPINKELEPASTQFEEDKPIEEEVVEEEHKEEKNVEDEPIEEYHQAKEPIAIEPEKTFHTAEVTIAPKNVIHDDLLEFIPDAGSHSNLLFDDMPKIEKKSLNDLLTEKKDDQTLGTKFQQSYIPDLTKAIAINEKFTFIRELFKNSGVDFSNAIQKLNDCVNIETAFVLMEELKHQYLWDTTSTSYLSLCDLVRRRFL